MTWKNLEGQRYVFNKGLFIITSPVEAWNFAKKNNMRSKQAFAKAINSIKTDPQKFSDRLEVAKKTYKDLDQRGDELTKEIMRTGSEIQKDSFEMSSEKFKESWKKLSMGYVGFAETNKDDFKALKKANTQILGRTQTEFKTMDEALKPVLGFLLEGETVDWKKHFKEGQYSFKDHYNKSGTRGNSITGLWDILEGYGSWTYNAIVKPSSKTAYKGSKQVAYYTTDTVLKTFIAAENVVYSLGSNVFYASKIGYRIVSPSLEAGYLSSLALLGVLNGTASSNVVRSVGLINKVAVKAVTPLVAGAQLAIEETASHTTNAATYIGYGAQGVGEVVFEKIESGVALGYSALSQIPAQILLTGVNAAIFIVYDGVYLSLASVSGKIEDEGIDEVPVGSVINIQKAREMGLKVKTISKDPEVIKKVLEHVE